MLAKFFLPLALTLLLAACGGGGGSSSPAPSSSSTTSANLPSVSVVIAAATYAANSAELGGWTTLQQARVLCGFGALRQNARLDAAAQAHARYLTSISLAAGGAILSHYETVNTDPFFTGYAPADRAQRQGYGTQVAEILASTVWTYDVRSPPALPSLEQRGSASMLGLLNTVYHLMGAMFDGADVGFGADIQTASDGTNRRQEYRFGSLNGYQGESQRVKLGTGNLATYPCEGSSNIPSTFIPANESPNPFPALTSASQTMGPPIYLKVDAGQVLTLTSGSLSAGSVSVPTTMLTQANDPQRKLQANEVFLVPNSALSANTSYQINLSGSIDGKVFSRSFTMSTGQ